MTVLLKNNADEGASTDDQDLLVILFEFFDQNNEITVPTDDDKGINATVAQSQIEPGACESHREFVENSFSRKWG